MKPGDLRFARKRFGTSINLVTLKREGGVDDVARRIEEGEPLILLDVTREACKKVPGGIEMWRLFTCHGILWSYGEHVRLFSREA